MKVIFITRGWPSNENIMRGNYEAVQAKALARRGLNVSVFCPGNAKKDEQKETDIFVEDGVTVYQYYPPQPQILRYLTLGLSNMWFCERELYKTYLEYVKRNGEPDLIHGHIIPVVNHCNYLLKKRHIPLVITEHWSRINYPLYKEPRLLLWKRMYKKASQVIAVSRQLANSLKEKLGVETTVIHNMVENRFFESPAIKKEENEGFRFISVGSLFPIKCFDILIKAFAQMQNKNATLDIIGGGTLKEELQKLINQYGLQNRVCLQGLKTPEEVSTYLNHSDCFVLASRSETFGIVLIEAMAKGLPVISTRCGGPEEFVTEENGVLVPPHDSSALAAAMDDIYTNIGRYDRNKIMRNCYDKYSEESISMQIVDIYKRVLHKEHIETNN